MSRRHIIVILSLTISGAVGLVACGGKDMDAKRKKDQDKQEQPLDKKLEGLSAECQAEFTAESEAKKKQEEMQAELDAAKKAREEQAAADQKETQPTEEEAVKQQAIDALTVTVSEKCQNELAALEAKRKTESNQNTGNPMDDMNKYSPSRSVLDAQKQQDAEQTGIVPQVMQKDQESIHEFFLSANGSETPVSSENMKIVCRGSLEEAAANKDSIGLVPGSTAMLKLAKAEKGKPNVTSLDCQGKADANNTKTPVLNDKIEEKKLVAGGLDWLEFNGKRFSVKCAARTEKPQMDNMNGIQLMSGSSLLAWRDLNFRFEDGATTADQPPVAIFRCQ